LCLALGHKSIGETFNLSAAEWAFWSEYHRKYGFPQDRVEGVVAKAGAYICRSNGAKVEPRDIIPRFGQRSAKSLAAAFAGIPGAKVERRPKVKQGTSEGTANG
jgi:hypothetical protein